MDEPRVITWQETADMAEDYDPIDDTFAKFIRIEDEWEAARMKKGVVEEEESDEGSEEEGSEGKLSDEGSEVEIQGEEMDFEKAVEARVRKRCDDLRMDEEEVLRMERDMEPKDKAVTFLAEADHEDEAARLKSLSDFNENNAREYPDFWTKMFSHRYGSYQDNTSIPAMRFTKTGRAPLVGTKETLQIFSVKVAGIRESLHWPLDIYGTVAIRDVLDHNRNIIFHRNRDNCQAITQEDPYLALTGPSRAVMLSVGTTTMEAMLKLKGDIESEDKEFSFLITSYRHFAPCYSIMRDRSMPSKLSTLEITVGYIINSVEATISVEVIDGSWPDSSPGKFIARTASIDDKEIVLLAFGKDKLPLGDDKKIELSRRVVSVEHPRYQGRLKVLAKAVCGTEKKEVLKGELEFTPQEHGESNQKFKVGSCEMKVTVAWSLLSSFPEL